MADRRLEERLQPSLLDRLTDDAPGDLQESREGRGIDTRKLRDILKRDLAWLLNTSNMESEISPDKFADSIYGDPEAGDLSHLVAERYPQAANSVLNYGVRPVSGSFATERRAIEIREAIEAAITKFEPRVSAGTLSVMLRSDENARETIITFDIRADMWAQPIPLDLYLRSEVDLTTGDLKLENVG